MEHKKFQLNLRKLCSQKEVIQAELSQITLSHGLNAEYIAEGNKITLHEQITST